MAVVDPEPRVHEITGRRVADAASMLTGVAGHTNAATIMIGERCAQLLHSIISQQGGKTDDREHCKIRQ